jgi:hypothetical protein
MRIAKPVEGKDGDTAWAPRTSRHGASVDLMLATVKVVNNIITRTAHYESFTVGGTGYNDNGARRQEKRDASIRFCFEVPSTSDVTDHRQPVTSLTTINQ